MKVAIVGAGIAGIAAARTLKGAEIESVIFEKSSSVGGRLATVQLGAFTFDSGVQNISPQGMKLESVLLNELDGSDLIGIEKPIFVHDGRRTSSGDRRKNLAHRYTYRQGNNELAKLLANGLDIRFDSVVDNIKKLPHDCFEVLGEEFDRLILAIPIPQASLLLWSLGEQRPIAPSRYRPCISIQLGYEISMPDLPYHALIDVEGTHPLQWIGIESIKSPDRAPIGQTAIVAQMNPVFSHNSWNWEDDRLVRSAATYVSWIFGHQWNSFAVSNVKKWKYSHPEEIVMFDKVNREDSKLVLAGDGVMGGRTEYAYESGIRAAFIFIGKKE